MLSNAEIFPIVSATNFADLIEKNPKITIKDLHNLKPKIMPAGIPLEVIMLDVIKYLVKYGPVSPCRLDVEN
jgi:hypothetical protein